MMECYDMPIMRKITSQKNLSPRERERLNRLKKIFREEGIIPPDTSLQEMRYLLRLEAGRKRYQRNRWPTISNQKAWKEVMKSADPSWDRPIEEILAQLAGKKDEQSGKPEK